MRMQRDILYRRRRVLQGALACLGVATVGLPRRARADEHRVLVIGDSMIAGGFGLFLEQALAKDHGLSVKRKGKSSTGLARPDFFDWHAVARALVEAYQPTATLVMFGGNDVQGLYMGKGEWIRWHEDGWGAEYSRRIAELCDILSPSGQRIFWVGMPVMRPAKFHARVQRVNAIYRAEMGVRPAGMFIDIWPLLADAEGAYADRIAIGPPGKDGSLKKVRVRAGDGIHLSPAGAKHLRDHVLAILLADLRGEAVAGEGDPNAGLADVATQGS
jgi:hypothetical protein